MSIVRERRNTDSGFTLVEMICTIAVLAILATVAMPLARNAVQRSKEAELRRDLEVMCAGINRYHQYAMAGAIPAWDPDWDYYPPDLDSLVEGIELNAAQSGKTQVQQFLREIPVDPLTGDRTWGYRSYQMESDDTTWDGANVFDVYSLSTGTALDGSSYSTWGCEGNTIGSISGNDLLR
jgi:general secretion pathway protein G